MKARIVNIPFLLLGLCFLTVTLHAQKSNKKKENTPTSNEKKQDESLAEWNDYFVVSSELILENKITGLAKTLGFTKKYPQNSAGYILLGDFYLENGQLSSAVDAYKKGIQLDENEKWYSLKLARAYQLGSMYKEAIDVYESLFKKNTQDPSPLFYVFQIYNSQKKYPEAAVTLEKIRDVVGESYEISEDLQRTYFRAGNYKASLQEIENLKKMRPEDADNYGKAAEIYLILGQKEKAMSEFNQVLKINPNDDQIHFSLASYYSHLTQWDKTIYHLGKAIGNASIDIDKKVLILLSLMDVNQAKNGFYSDSIKIMMNDLSRVHPGSAKVHSLRGDFFMSIYDYKEADASFSEVVKLDPNKWVIWSQLMYVQRLREEYERLNSSAESVQELFPNNPEPFLYKGVSQAFMKQSNIALAELEMGEALLFDIGELSSAFWVAKAENECMNSDYNKSITYFKKALDQAPGNIDAKIKLAYVLIMDASKISDAEQLLKESEKEGVDLFYFYACKGLLHLRKNNRTEAQKMLELAKKFGGENHSWTLELNGDLSSLDGKKEQAMNFWNLAAKKGMKSAWLTRKINTGSWVE